MAQRELHHHLKTLTDAVLQFLDEHDRLMRLPATPERGRKIAQLANKLEMANDRARYFGLGVDFRSDKKERRS